MVQKQRMPWATIIGFTSLFCFIGWLFGIFEPAAKAVPKQQLSAEVAKTPTPIVSQPVELTPEETARRAAQSS